MAIVVEKAAQGNAPATGMPKTPAPTKRVIPTAPDVVTAIRSPRERGMYGANGFEGASSTVPGTTVTSDLAENLKASSDDGENVLDKIIATGMRGLAGADDWQRRQVSDAPFPPAFGMKNANSGGAPSGKVPDALGQSETPDPDRNEYGDASE